MPLTRSPSPWDNCNPMSDTKLGPNVTPLVREIHRRMVELGLNAASLSLSIGRNQTYFRDLFSGRSRAPNVEFLPAIADALGCDINDLLNPGTAGEEPGVHSEVYEPDERALIGFWRMLRTPAKHRILNAIIR